jgi:gluconokinase
MKDADVTIRASVAKQSAPTPRAVVVMGVAGSGKTTVGRVLASQLSWRFQDADDLHSPENVARMRQGLPLDDASREPWLARVRAVIDEARKNRQGLVVACSALKERYRVVLSNGIPDLRFVFLDADRELLRKRLTSRQSHFAGAVLLDSQLEALERPAEALRLDASRPLDELVRAVIADLSR